MFKKYRERKQEKKLKEDEYWKNYHKLKNELYDAIDNIQDTNAKKAIKIIVNKLFASWVF